MSNTLIQPIDVAPVPRLALRREEAAEALGVSDRWLWQQTKTGDVPHVRVGGVVMYPVAGLVFATVTLLGCLPVYMSVPTEEVAAWLVPNVAFGVFSALFGGVLMALAMLFVFYEVPEASSRSEFCWWIVFLSTGMVTFLTGCFL